MNNYLDFKIPNNLYTEKIFFKTEKKERIEKVL